MYWLQPVLLGAALTWHTAAIAAPEEKILNVFTWPDYIAPNTIADFEAEYGIKVNYDTPGFLIYNQRVDLELSTKGAAYDVLNITFIYVDRWIRSMPPTRGCGFASAGRATPRPPRIPDGGTASASRSMSPRTANPPTSSSTNGTRTRRPRRIVPLRVAHSGSTSTRSGRSRKHESLPSDLVSRPRTAKVCV